MRPQAELAIQRALSRKHREFLRFKCLLRIAERDEAILKKNRVSIMEWYCRDLYVESVKLAMVQFKAELVRVEVKLIYKFYFF